MDGGGPFLVVLQVGFFFFGVSTPAGRGGVGSGVCWRLGGEVGWPGRCCVGGKTGGAGELVLGPCPFIESKFRRAAAVGSCGRLHLVVVPPPWRQVVRRCRRRLGFSGARWWI